ncbi:MAG TPA: hypothetical protein VIL46_02045 [Gemmataceae bacterium]
MTRLLPLALGGALLLTAPARADAPAGAWTMTFPLGNRSLTFLLNFSQDDGKWVGDFLDSTPELRVEPTIEEVAVKDGHFRYSMKFGDDTVAFDGRIGEGGKVIRGTFTVGGPLMLVEMHPSKLKNLDDAYAVARERLEHAEGQELFDAAFAVLGQAGEKKVGVEEVRAVADRAAKAAERYGPRWEREVALRLARTLAGQEGMGDAAVEQARRAERMLDPRGETAVQLEVLETLALALEKAGKADELKQTRARLERLEKLDFLQYSKKFPPFKPEKFEGRKGGGRAVLVELFTGAECPPCVAADLAFDALDKTFGPAEAVLLQYHLHIPGPDPLTSPDSQDRAEYYGAKIRGTPTVLFNGEADGTGGGPIGLAKEKYAAYREEVVGLLDKPAPLKLTLAASRKGDEVTVKANVSDLEKPGEKITLRFALVEELVRYEGGNGLRYHHHVVRAMPGGAKGFALTEKSAEKIVAVNLAEIRKSLNQYLDEFAKQLREEGDDFPRPERPLALNNLHVVAFVQNDETQEVLHAVRVPVGE